MTDLEGAGTQLSNEKDSDPDSAANAASVDPLFLLLHLADSALPTGAFSHSFGFETYIAQDRLTDEASMLDWLRTTLHVQLCTADALAIRMVHRALAQGRKDLVWQIDDALHAGTLSRELRDGNARMGERTAEIVVDNYGYSIVAEYLQRIQDGHSTGHTAVTHALTTYSAGIDATTTVRSHLLATAQSLVQNAVRGIPIGQMAGQRVLFNVREDIEQIVRTSARLRAVDLCTSDPGLEISQMIHETQRARMFMS